MTGDRYQEARRQGFEMGLSPARAIQQAGGAVPHPHDMDELTLTEFVCRVAAQNGIRFHFETPEERAAKDGNGGVKLMLVQRDRSNGDVLVIYEDGREVYITDAEHAAIIAERKAQPRKERATLNPCGEIPLGNPQPVQPWVQVQLMQSLRQESGKSLYTTRELQLLTDSLEYQAELEKTKLIEAKSMGD